MRRAVGIAERSSMAALSVIGRGEHCIADAHFVRKNIVPMAYKAGRWNIVVFECFRVVELLLKGIACLSGRVPKETHDLGRVVDDLVSYLARQHESPPLFASLRSKNNDRYGISLTSRNLSLYLECAGSWSLLAVDQHQLSSDEIVRLILHVEHFVITVSVDGRPLIRHTDATLAGPFRFRRAFARAPRAASVASLKRLSGKLRLSREAAFFSTREFTRSDAKIAISHMNLALGVSKSFYVER
jgi:hypothetical protein